MIGKILAALACIAVGLLFLWLGLTTMPGVELTWR